MRDYSGIGWSSLPDPNESDFVPRMRSMLGTVDYFLRDLSRGVQRIQNGQVPDGSGNTIPVGQNGTLLDYLYLPGRAGGQTVRSVDTAITVQIDSGTTPLGTDGGIGDAALRLNFGTSPLVDFRPYRFGASNIELVLTGSATAGIPVNFLSDDGTSAFRIASTTNRTYLQAGLKLSSGQVGNANMTIGGAGARVGSSLAYEFQRISLNVTGAQLPDGSAATARTARVALNLSADDYSGTAQASKAGSLHVGAIGGWIATDPAPLVLENTGFTDPLATGLTPNLFEVRGASTGSSPTKALGSLVLGIRADGMIRFYNSGNLRTLLEGTGADGELIVSGAAGENVLATTRVTRWADSAASTSLRLGVTTANVMLAGGGFNIMARLGISATSTVMGPCASNTMPAPLSSRILTVVDSGATVLSGFDSAGAYFLVSGAGSGKVYTSNGSGVGSWATLGSLTADFADNAFSIHDEGDATKLLVTSLGGATTGKTLTLISSHTDNRSVTFPNATTTLAGLAATQTFTAANLFQPTGDVQPVYIDGTNVTTQNLFGVAAGGVDYMNVDVSGVFNVVAFKVHNSTIGSGGDAQFSTTALSGSRTITLLDGGGSMPLVATIVSVNTNQSADLASGNFTLNTTGTFLYRVECFLECTAADAGAGTLTVTIGWTDNVGATTATIPAEVGTLPLPLTATGRASGSITIRRASGNITRSITGGGTYGTARYRYFFRVTCLG